MGTTFGRRGRLLRFGCPDRSSAADFFVHLLQGARPIFSQQPRQRTIGEEPPLGLALRAVVRLVIRVANPLYCRAADWARLTESSMHGHPFSEGGHLLGEPCSCLVA